VNENWEWFLYPPRIALGPLTFSGGIFKRRYKNELNREEKKLTKFLFVVLFGRWLKSFQEEPPPMEKSFITLSDSEIDVIQIVDASPNNIFQAENEYNSIHSKLSELENDRSRIYGELMIKYAKNSPSWKPELIKAQVATDKEYVEINGKCGALKADCDKAKAKLNFYDNLFVAARKKMGK
jgi:hypothetical protein